MSELFYGLIAFATQLVETLSYFGIFIAMAIEATSIPIPSEVIMGFAGFLVAQGSFQFWPAVFAGSFGNLIGSTLMYGLGAKGGRPFVKKYGKYLRIYDEEIEKADAWFAKYGDKAVFFAQVMPVLRTFISVPAGMLKISYPRFALFTFMGATIWCAILVYAGQQLGNNWEQVTTYVEPFQNIIIVLGAVVLGYIVYKHYFKRVD